MAANVGKISMEIVVTDKGSAVVKSATDRMMAPLKKLGSRVAGIVKSFLSWRNVIGLLAGAAGIGLLIKKVTALSAAQEMAEKKLEQAMRSTKMWNVNLMENYKGYASQLQDLTGIGDEVTLGVMAMLQTFKLQEGTLKDATKATLDLAKATGQDLQSAAILVGKAAVGEISTLKRYGIIVDEAAYKARGFQAVLDEINVEFGGMAEAQAQTYTGKINKMMSFWGDLLEKVGDTITKNPVILQYIDVVTGKFKEWGGKLEAHRDEIEAWVSSSVKILAGWITSFLSQMTPIFEALKAFPAYAEQIMTSLKIVTAPVWLTGKALGTGAAILSAEHAGAGGAANLGILGKGYEAGKEAETTAPVTPTGGSGSIIDVMNRVNQKKIEANIYINEKMTGRNVAQDVKDELDRLSNR